MSAVDIGKKVLRWLPVVLGMGVIFYLSAQPDLPHHPEAMLDVVIKKLGHMAEYGILTALVLWALGGQGHSTSRRHYLYAFAVAGLYAVSDETHQYFVPGRNPQPLDVGFDVLGSLVALVVIWSVTRARESTPVL